MENLMFILAIDTSGQSGGITLAEANENSFRLIESSPIAGGTFSAQLIPTLAALLSKHGFAVKDLGGFAAASGPGSFTGLRVGLSAIKGLAETLHKPIAVVSVLEALAALADRVGKIAAALDAGRKEVFLGIYEKLAENPARSAVPHVPCAILDRAFLPTFHICRGKLLCGRHRARRRFFPRDPPARPAPPAQTPPQLAYAAFPPGP